MKRILIFIFLVLFLVAPIFSQYSEKDYQEVIQFLIESNEKLIEYSEGLENQVEELKNNIELLRNSLYINNSTILELKNQIIKDKEEISVLRNQIEEVFTQLDEDKNNSIGLGISYPLGGTIVYSIRPKNFPVGGFIAGNLNKDLVLSVSLGASYSF